MYNGSPTPDMLRNLVGYSTISYNYATRSIGGGRVVGNVTTLIDSTTVASNSTLGDVGGLYLRGFYAAVANSTIAFNTAAGSGAMATGLQLRSHGHRREGRSLQYDRLQQLHRRGRRTRRGRNRRHHHRF